MRLELPIKSKSTARSGLAQLTHAEHEQEETTLPIAAGPLERSFYFGTLTLLP